MVTKQVTSWLPHKMLSQAVPNVGDLRKERVFAKKHILLSDDFRRDRSTPGLLNILGLESPSMPMFPLQENNLWLQALVLASLSSLTLTSWRTSQGLSILLLSGIIQLFPSPENSTQSLLSLTTHAAALQKKGLPSFPVNSTRCLGDHHHFREKQIIRLCVDRVSPLQAAEVSFSKKGIDCFKWLGRIYASD